MHNDQENSIGDFFNDCAHESLMTSFNPDDFESLNRFFEDWNFHSGERIFEPGCGSGRLTELIAPRVAPSGAVYACDLSCAMISLAMDRKLPEQVKLYRGSVIDVPVGDGFFDKVILFQVFPHFNDKPLALREIHRVLKHGGDLWINHLKSREEINTFHRNSTSTVIFHLIPDDNELITLLESSGFNVDIICNSIKGYYAHARKQ
jgi:ubiquinone/menaquinone biosynthesis C-methylase UbiE